MRATSRCRPTQLGAALCQRERGTCWGGRGTLERLRAIEDEITGANHRAASTLENVSSDKCLVVRGNIVMNTAWLLKYFEEHPDAAMTTTDVIVRSRGINAFNITKAASRLHH